MENGTDIKIDKKRGRPFGYKLSDKTKEKIRQKRLGTSHTQETKDKISRSLIEYFKGRDSLAKSIGYEYSYISDEAVDWVYENRNNLDDMKDVMTDRRLSHIKHLEICMGTDIESMFGHNITPEFLVLLKEKIASTGYNLQEFYSLV